MLPHSSRTPAQSERPPASCERTHAGVSTAGRVSRWLRHAFMLAGIGLMLFSNTGCSYLLFRGFVWDLAIINWSKFWLTTPPIPVSPYWSELIEDTYWEEERYGRAPVLDPVEGEHAPLFCMDPPTPDEVMRALPDEVGGGVPFLAETQRNNVRITVEPIVDSLGECKFYPLVGPARLHKCHYKCTVYYEKTIRSEWPIPYSHKDNTVEVVYIDHDHLIRCAGPIVGNP